ncbi:MAG: TMEM175 family protein [Chloroflexota bacterium]|nr:TMEM175 family protein [Chloroflexota bacterium]
MRALRRTASTGRDTDRLEAFSDGVIAIAITLLVLEVRVPTEAAVEDAGGLGSALLDLWPNYLGYLLSFVIIGIMWANHHEIFRHVVRTDHYLVLINLLFLFCIGFIPFPTALMAENLGHDGERTAVIVYAGWILLTALSYYLLWRYPSGGGRLLAPDADRGAVETITQRFRLGPPSYALAFALAFLYPPASLALLFLLAVLYVLPNAAAV